MMRPLLLLCLVAAYAVGAMRCPVELPSGEIYDLSRFTAASPLHATVTAGENIGQTVFFTACDTSTSVAKCTKDGASLCVLNSKKAWMFSVAKFHSQSDIKSVTKKDDGISLQFENMSDYELKTMRAIVTLTCASSPGPVTASITTSKQPAVFSITAAHPAGCVKGAGGGGLSGGWIFIIVFLSVAVAYVVAGCIINWRVRGLPLGTQACPNSALWCAIPGLVKDGAVFTVRKLKACCGGSKGEQSTPYDDVATDSAL